MFKDTRVLLVVLGLMGVLAFFLACASPIENVPTPESVGTMVLPTATPLGAGVKPIPGGILRGYYATEPPYWDPNQGSDTICHTALNRVHATLLQFYFGPEYSRWSFDIDPVNSLAQSWEVSKDGLTYTFHLRQGVRWQNKPPMNGREFVAQDVKWTYERHIASAGAPRREQMQVIQSIECPDKYTVVIRLKERRAEFLLLLANPYVEILAPELVTVTGDLNSWKVVVGLGPFMLKEYGPNVRIVYEKNPTYYRANEGLPYLDELRFILIGDASTSLAAFRAEKIDIRGVSRLDLPSVKQTNPKVYCYENEIGVTSNALAFNTAKAPFNNVLLRRAVSMAFDRKAVIDTFYFGYGIEQNQAIHVASQWYLQDQGECAKYNQYNPEEARRLMAEAGYPNGLSVSLACSPAVLGSENVEFWADSLSKIGITVTLKPMEWGAFYSTVYTQHNYDHMAFLTKWSGATFGADAWTVRMYAKGSTGNTPNVDDPVLEAMLNAQTVEMDPVKRQEILNEIQRHCACQQYYIHWPHAYGVSCQQPWVRNYAPHAVECHSGRIAELIWLTEDSPGRK